MGRCETLQKKMKKPARVTLNDDVVSVSVVY